MNPYADLAITSDFRQWMNIFEQECETLVPGLLQTLTPRQYEGIGQYHSPRLVRDAIANLLAMVQFQ